LPRGSTWALRCASLYGPEPGAPEALTLASPPWQSVQPSTTAFEVCMLLASVSVWQLMQPALLRSAASRACFAGAIAWPGGTSARMTAEAGTKAKARAKAQPHSMIRIDRRLSPSAMPRSVSSSVRELEVHERVVQFRPREPAAGRAARHGFVDQ